MIGLQAYFLINKTRLSADVQVLFYKIKSKLVSELTFQMIAAVINSKNTDLFLHYFFLFLVHWVPSKSISGQKSLHHSTNGHGHRHNCLPG